MVVGVDDGVRKLTVRAREGELALWREAAWVRRVSLSQWVRLVLTATAERTMREEGEDG